MNDSSVNIEAADVNALIKDAQALLQSAATLTGEKADDLRKRAMAMLDAALVNAQQAKLDVVAAGRKAAASADGYVRANPWQMIGAAAGIGLLVGYIMGRK